MWYPEHLEYPEARHHGDKGEVNAAFRPADTPPDISSPGASTHYLATDESTGGEFRRYKVELGARSRTGTSSPAVSSGGRGPSSNHVPRM